ncbi:hypothetical protein ACFV27_01590 [Streptomyces antimycoticus]|uniref:hypothetical protein n=1 Tax=Streptomyces antimycoticus TaxID=68175 RepID=UPI0036AD1320
MARVDRFHSMYEQLEQGTSDFFEPSLKKLGLTVEQIRGQSLEQLEVSLETVNDALRHPDSFGLMKVTANARAGAVVLAAATTEAHLEVGIVPILLERKGLILSCIKALQPAAQIERFRAEVEEKVGDPAIREQLLKALEEHAAMQKELSSRLEKESVEAASALIDETASVTHAVAMAKLEARTDSLEKLAAKLDSDKAGKFDVVTITLTMLAGVGGLTGAVIAVIRWVTG